MTNEPKNLIEAVQYFSDEAKCVEFIAGLKWADGKPHCPKCGSDNCVALKTRKQYQCREKGCRRQFSVKQDTIFQDCNMPLSKFLPCFWLIASAKNGISSYEVARALGVCQKTGWLMLHKARKAMGTDEFLSKLSGKIEIDETYVGGKAKNMHSAKREALKKNRRVTGDKTVVLGMVERGGQVRAKVVSNARRKNLLPEIQANIESGSNVYTDKLRSYDTLKEEYTHSSVDHQLCYVDGETHTNTLEGFWNLFKRGLHGTYTHIAPFHCDRYLDEETFRYNFRKTNDLGRFMQLMSQIFGKRLTFDELIGAEKA